MALARSAREGVAIAGPSWLDPLALVGRLPKTELPSHLSPILITAFVGVVLVGFILQILHSRRAELDSARHSLGLMADVAALNLEDKALKPDTSWQAALAASLPKGATADGRTVLLADGDGYIKARAPLEGSASGNLLTILGPQQPLTIFGADAGVLEIALADGTDAIVTVRDVPKTDAQLAFVQPVDEALVDWRSATRLEITLLLCTGLMLALYAGGLRHRRPAAKREHDDALRKELTEALPGCGIWRWNLA